MGNLELVRLLVSIHTHYPPLLQYIIQLASLPPLQKSVQSAVETKWSFADVLERSHFNFTKKKKH